MYLIGSLFSLIIINIITSLQLTTHVLDTSRGKPAEGISVSVSLMSENGSWTVLGLGYVVVFSLADPSCKREST